jgi:DNA-binding NarL/FixJ family response regulator
MRILYHNEGEDDAFWLAGLRNALPQADIRLWFPGDTEPADYALIWKAPAEMLAKRTDLKAIFNLAAGVDGFIHRSVSRESLVAAIDDCIQGRRTILTGNENNLLYDVLHATHKSTNAPSLLTGREKDVLDCVLQGMSNSEIASELHIAAGTVKAHIGHLLRKHGVSSRTKLAIQAAYHTQEN